MLELRISEIFSHLRSYLKDNYHAVINPLIFSEDGGPIKVLKVAILPLDNYWVINMWIFASLDKGIAKYHKVAFKKSGSAAFNYNIEGTSTVPENKITEFPI